YYLAFTLGMVYISASQGALVQASIPAMTALVAALWLRERASGLRWLGIAMSIAGVLIVFSGGAADSGEASQTGNLLIFASVVCWALYTALVKRVAAFDSLVITVAVMGTGAILLLPIAGYELIAAHLAGESLQSLPLMGWAGMLYLGVVASG